MYSQRTWYILLSVISTYSLISDLKVVVGAVNHTVAGSQDVLGSYQGSTTEMAISVHQWNHPGIFIFLQKITINVFSVDIFSPLTEAAKPPRILKPLLFVFLPHRHPEEYQEFSWEREGGGGSGLCLTYQQFGTDLHTSNHQSMLKITMNIIYQTLFTRVVKRRGWVWSQVK